MEKFQQLREISYAFNFQYNLLMDDFLRIWVLEFFKEFPEVNSFSIESFTGYIQLTKLNGINICVDLYPDIKSVDVKMLIPAELINMTNLFEIVECIQLFPIKNFDELEFTRHYNTQFLDKSKIEWPYKKSEVCGQMESLVKQLENKNEINT